MSTFDYQARTRDGTLEAGTIEAFSEEAVLDILQRRNLVVVAVKEKKGAPLWNINIAGSRPRAKDIVILSRQLATLFEARIPLVEALKALEEEASKESIRKVISKILEDITGGLSVSQAFAKHPTVFSVFYISLIRSGEESGKLQQVFSYLADQVERSYVLTTKARNAMIYPSFILMAFIGVIILLLVSVIPGLVSIFEETGQPIPVYTKLIISVAQVLKQWGWAFFLLFAGMGVFAWRWNYTPEGRIFFAKVQLRIPLIGSLYRKLYVARFSDNLQVLISSGVPILRALEVTKAVAGSVVFQKSLDEAIELVKGGGTISGAFRNNPEIPIMVTQMIKIGETSGRLDFILEKISKFYQQEVNSMVDNLVSLIEPILIITLGIGIGLLVASILVPLYNLVGVL